jgi:hypothetical protein
MPPPGEVFLGAQGRTLEEASLGVKHGGLSHTTAGEIRAGVGSVKPAPEFDRGVGTVNHQHVDICMGPGGCSWTGPVDNPIAKIGRFGGADYPFHDGYP